MKSKILLVIGTRPEAIKMAPLYHQFKNHLDEFDPLICVTGQHKEMLNQVLSVFDIHPDIDMSIMTPHQDLFEVTTHILLGMREILNKFKPNLILVHGDTTTALAASMAGFYSNIPVGHIEAGLRTYNIHKPFPEEFNRQTISKIAKLHFAPTKVSYKNLINEGINKNNITITGNTVIDALDWTLNRLNGQTDRYNHVIKHIDDLLGYEWMKSKYILVTGHRRENFGNGLMQICNALRHLAINHSRLHIIFPVHLNPNVQALVNKALNGISNIHLIPPQDYEVFLVLLKFCHLVITDSGGIQEEAPSLDKPVLITREVTERPEAISAGAARLVGADENQIICGVTELLDDNDTYLSMSRAVNPYGDGSAAKKIINYLRSFDWN